MQNQNILIYFSDLGVVLFYFLTLFSWAKSFSLLDPPRQPAFSAALGARANPAAPDPRARVQPPPPAQFPYPSLINDPVTARIRQYSLED